MTIKMRGFLQAIFMHLICIANLSLARGETSDHMGEDSIWAHDNFLAWGVIHYDAMKRGPEERARMLEELGIKRFAYDWYGDDTASLDADIEALQRHKIEITAWLFPINAEDPKARIVLESFRRHGIAPQLWLLPPFQGLLSPEQDKIVAAAKTKKETETLFMSFMRKALNATPKEYSLRVKREAERVSAIVKLAAPYTSKIALYNHGAWSGWEGMTDSQISVIRRLKELGIGNVGIVYNFANARDELHDDTKDFPAVWEKLHDHVVAVNVTGVSHLVDDFVYPSQGESELGMMKVIQHSKWAGFVGLVAEMGGDAEVTLRNYMVGLDWLAAESQRLGSGGPRPFPRVVSSSELRK